MPVTPPYFARLRRSLGVYVFLVAGAGPLAAAPAAMRAIVQDGFGGPQVLKLETVPVPVPRPGEVRIHVYAAAVNPTDWRFREGKRGTQPPPVIPGQDVAGVIDALGEGVTGLDVGEPVFAALDSRGGYAEYAIAKAEDVAAKPRTFTYEQAAGIPTAGGAGMRALLASGIERGRRLAIIGAAGGVGSTAVQIALARGVQVLASAASSQADYLRSLGVTEIAFYDTEDVAAKIQNVDAAINTANGEEDAAIGYVKRGGVLVSLTGAPDPAKCDTAGVDCRTLGPRGYPTPGTRAELLMQLAALADTGRYKVFVDKVYPLQDAAEAQEDNRTGDTTGKLVLSLSPRSAAR